MKIEKNTQFMYQKTVLKKYMLTYYYYVLTKDFCVFMYDHILHCRRKHFCRYCLQTFGKDKKLKIHIKDRFRITGKQRIRMPKKGEFVKFKNYEGKIKSPFKIYADFESILETESFGNQNPEESNSNKYQKLLFAVVYIN